MYTMCEGISSPRQSVHVLTYCVIVPLVSSTPGMNTENIRAPSIFSWVAVKEDLEAGGDVLAGFVTAKMQSASDELEAVCHPLSDLRA